MWSLKKMIPSLAQQQTVDAVDILDEATNHIHRLEEKLLEKVIKKFGLPKKERGRQKKIALNIVHYILQCHIQEWQM